MGKNNKPSGLIFNGKFVKHPYGARYIRDRMLLKEHLENIQLRLKNEVGFMMETIIERNKQEPYIGFFALTRMIMPVVETVARTEGLTGSQLLAKLDVTAPELIWRLYRNVFMHNDEFQLGRIGRRGIPSGLIITSEKDEPVSGFIKNSTLLDIGSLYRNLLGYIDTKIEEAPPNKKADYISGIWFPRSQKLSKRIQMEVDKIDLAHEELNKETVQ